MTDKVQKIREEVKRLRNLHQMKYQQIDTNDNMCLVECGKRNLCNDLLYFIDSMQEEPVSEELEEACEQLAENARKYKAETSSPFFSQTDYKQGVIDGANWQKANLWKPADGDDLPEIDREVVAILDYDFGHYKVVYAHRPNPNGWNGTNIDTGEKEHFEPVIYDKGGWNQPHVLYWLDTRLPYEENKIIK